jgi:hypothetical protein
VAPGAVLHKHRWVKEPAELRCFDCGATRPVARTFRCRIGMHSYMAIEREGAQYEECLYCRKVPLTNRFYY